MSSKAANHYSQCRAWQQRQCVWTLLVLLGFFGGCLANFRNLAFSSAWEVSVISPFTNAFKKMCGHVFVWTSARDRAGSEARWQFSVELTQEAEVWIEPTPCVRRFTLIVGAACNPYQCFDDTHWLGIGLLNLRMQMTRHWKWAHANGHLRPTGNAELEPVPLIPNRQNMPFWLPSEHHDSFFLFVLLALLFFFFKLSIFARALHSFIWLNVKGFLDFAGISRFPLKVWTADRPPTPTLWCEQVADVSCKILLCCFGAMSVDNGGGSLSWNSPSIKGEKKGSCWTASSQWNIDAKPLVQSTVCIPHEYWCDWSSAQRVHSSTKRSCSIIHGGEE